VDDFIVLRWTEAFWVGLRDLVPVAYGSACIGNLKRQLEDTETCILPLPGRLGRAPTFLAPIINLPFAETASTQAVPKVYPKISKTID
jgi:hypothetical protein